MKRFVFFPLLLALTLLAACHPSAPKEQPAARPIPPATQTAAAPTAPAPVVTASQPAQPAPVATSSETVSSTQSAPMPPAPLLGPNQPGTGTSSPTVATASAPLPPVLPAPRNVRGLHILAPEGHISEGLRQELAIMIGTEITVDTYTSNDEALNKLNAGTYHLALVSYRIIPALIGDQKLAPLPALPLALQPAPKYQHHFFDRENKYSLPYAFSLAAIAQRLDQVKTPVLQWGHLFNDATLKNTQLPDDPRFVATLQAKGGLRNVSVPNLKNDEAGTEPRPIEVDSIATLKKRFATQPGWRFVLPGEGSVIYLYCIVVPANSPAPDKTPALLQQIFHPEVIARIAEENYLGVTQIAAYRLLPPASTGDGLIYPREDILNKCIFVRPPARANASENAESR